VEASCHAGQLEEIVDLGRFQMSEVEGRLAISSPKQESGNIVENPAADVSGAGLGATTITFASADEDTNAVVARMPAEMALLTRLIVSNLPDTANIWAQRIWGRKGQATLAYRIMLIFHVVLVVERTWSMSAKGSGDAEFEGVAAVGLNVTAGVRQVPPNALVFLRSSLCQWACSRPCSYSNLSDIRSFLWTDLSRN
jgi:hypothetical protein